MKLERGGGGGKEITEGQDKRPQNTSHMKQSSLWETEKDQQEGAGQTKESTANWGGNSSARGSVQLKC